MPRHPPNPPATPTRDFSRLGSLAVEQQVRPDAVDLSVLLPAFNESRNIVAIIEPLSDVTLNLKLCCRTSTVDGESRAGLPED
jgi:hypothetical protein